MDALKQSETRDRVFLSLLRAAVHNETAELPEGIDCWPAVFSLSADQQVLPMIVDAAYRCKAAVPPELMSQAQAMSLRLVMQQTLHTQSFLKLYRFLCERGLQPAVLKGLICRSLYPEPDQRRSGDEDMLIDPRDLDTVHDALLAFGLHCELEQISPDMHEITYLSNQLHIELHLSLFPADSRAFGDCNELFDEVLEHAVSLDFNGVSIKTLCPTDHLLYLICHTYKHFLHSGVGIRQICDIDMFAKHYQAEIDWARILNSCRRIRIERFTAALFRIGVKYLGFEIPDEFAGIQGDETALLNDILSGGVYGATDEDRQHSSTITLEAVEAQKEGRKGKGALASVFRPLESLVGQYPYLEKHPWLLPVAWTQRVFRYLFRRDRGGSINPSESIRIGKERTQLLREYGIID